MITRFSVNLIASQAYAFSNENIMDICGYSQRVSVVSFLFLLHHNISVTLLVFFPSSIYMSLNEHNELQ